MILTLRRKILFIKAAVSAAFFFVLFGFVQHNELISVFKGVNWTFFTLSFVMAVVMLMISCLKWKLLLDASGQKVDYLLLLRVYSVGYFFSNLLPSTFGGDVVRSYYVGKIIQNQASSAASVFLERFIGIIVLLLFVISAPLMHPELYRIPYVYIPASGAALLLLLIMALWRMKEPFSLPNRIVSRLFTALTRLAAKLNSPFFSRCITWIENGYQNILKKLRVFKNELQTSSSIIRRDRKLLGLVIFLTFLFYLLTWLNVYVSFLAFNVHPDFIAISALVPTIMLVGQIPLTFLGNLGFFESVFVFYFLLVKIPAAATLAMGLLLRLKIIWLGIMGYFVYISITRENSDALSPLSGEID